MPRHDTRPLLVKGQAGTVGTYPPVVGLPSSATVRIGTGSKPMPTSGSAAAIDSFNATLTAAGAQGDTSLTLSATAPVITDVHAPTTVACADSLTLGSTTLAANTVYTISIPVSMESDTTLSSPDGFLTGTITGTVTTDATGITVNSQSTSYSFRAGTLATATVSVTGSGLSLQVIFSVGGGLFTVGDTVTSSYTATCTSHTVGTGVATRGQSYLVDGTTVLISVVSDQDTGAVGTTLALAEPLPCAIANGATVKGWRISATVSSGDTATIGPGVAEWQATIGGVVHKWSTAFRVVERDGTYTLTPDTLTSSSPYCRDNRPDNDNDCSEMIDAAWRRFVEPDLLGKALRPERIVHGPHFEAVHIAACEYFIALEFEDDQVKRAERRSLLATAVEKVLNASDLWITSEVEDLTNADPNALGLSGNLAGTMPIGTYPDGSPMYATNDFDVCFISR